MREPSGGASPGRDLPGSQPPASGLKAWEAMPRAAQSGSTPASSPRPRREDSFRVAGPAPPAAVGVRRVEPVDAVGPGRVHDREGLLLGLAVAEQLGRRADPPEVAAAEDDPRHRPSLGP